MIDLEREEWRDIAGYEGLYQVSNMGRVKSLNYKRTCEERVLKPAKKKCGYLEVLLYKDGKTKHWKVHRLVAVAFIPNPDSLPQVNHKDECKTNNNVWNLEWCTHEYNQNYGTRNERAGSKISSKLKGKPKSEETKKKISENIPKKAVQQFTLEGELIATYQSISEAQRVTGTCKVWDCCNHKPHHKTAGGFKWSYL